MASMQATCARPIPRKIELDPESARTVVHEVYSHRRRPTAACDTTSMVPVTGRQDKEDGNRPPKAGILPDRGVIAARRRSAIEPRDLDRNSRKFYDADSDIDTDSERRRPRHHRSHRHHHHHSPNPTSHMGSSRSSDSTSSSQSHSHRRHRSGNELTRYDPGLDRDIHVKDHKHGSHDDSSSDSDSDYDPNESQKARRHALLYTGLAGVTTLACANGIYQHTKGFHARSRAFKDHAASHPGDTYEEKTEREKARKKRLTMDLLSAGLIGVGLYNARVGWGRQREKTKVHREAEQRAYERGVRRREREERKADGKYSVEEA